jgi:hypothetical protein
MNTIDIRHINNEIVRPLPTKVDTRKVKGCDICAEAYANIFLCAKKKSGKTVALSHILRRCAGKQTKVIAFVSTLHKDKMWKAIQKMLEAKGIEFEGYTSIHEENKLAEIIEDAKQADEDSEEEEEEDELNKIHQARNNLQLHPSDDIFFALPSPHS